MGANDQIGALDYSSWIFTTKGKERSSLEQRLTALFEELRDPLFRYLLVLVSASHAEDIAQECFLRLFLELRAGKHIDNVRSWLYRVGHNLTVDLLRARPEETLGDFARSLADEKQLSSEETLIQEQRLSAVRAAIGRLSKQQRLCLHLRTESFRYREIAEILNISESSVCENLRRGLSRLIKDCHEA